MNTPIVFNALVRKPTFVTLIGCAVAAVALIAAILETVSINKSLSRVSADAEELLRKQAGNTTQKKSRPLDIRLNRASELLATPWEKLLNQIEASRPVGVVVTEVNVNATERTVLIASRTSSIRYAHELSESLDLQGFKDVKLLSIIVSKEAENKVFKVNHSIRWRTHDGS
jgi:hypothetical protein